jgi:hypothetical protein
MCTADPAVLIRGSAGEHDLSGSLARMRGAMTETIVHNGGRNVPCNVVASRPYSRFFNMLLLQMGTGAATAY